MSFNQQDRVSWLWLFIFLSYSTGITEDDPRWLGAWWIGFLLAWLFAWSLIIPFSCFPKHLPGKYIFFKARELYFNSRTNIAFSMIDKNLENYCFIESYLSAYANFWISVFILGNIVEILIFMFFLLFSINNQ